MLVDFFIISYWFRLLFKERNRSYAELLIVIGVAISIAFHKEKSIIHSS